MQRQRHVNYGDENRSVGGRRHRSDVRKQGALTYTEQGELVPRSSFKRKRCKTDYGEGEMRASRVKQKVAEFNLVFLDTSLGTNFALRLSSSDSVSDVKEKIVLEHKKLFPTVGEIQVHSVKVQRRANLYSVPDTVLLWNVFHGEEKGNWFLSVDVSEVNTINDVKDFAKLVDAGGGQCTTNLEQITGDSMKLCTGIVDTQDPNVELNKVDKGMKNTDLKNNQQVGGDSSATVDLTTAIIRKQLELSQVQNEEKISGVAGMLDSSVVENEGSRKKRAKKSTCISDNCHAELPTAETKIAPSEFNNVDKECGSTVIKKKSSSRRRKKVLDSQKCDDPQGGVVSLATKEKSSTPQGGVDTLATKEKSSTPQAVVDSFVSKENSSTPQSVVDSLVSKDRSSTPQGGVESLATREKSSTKRMKQKVNVSKSQKSEDPQVGVDSIASKEILIGVLDSEQEDKQVDSSQVMHSKTEEKGKKVELAESANDLKASEIGCEEINFKHYFVSANDQDKEDTSDKVSNRSRGDSAQRSDRDKKISNSSRRSSGGSEEKVKDSSTRSDTTLEKHDEGLAASSRLNKKNKTSDNSTSVRCKELPRKKGDKSAHSNLNAKDMKTPQKKRLSLFTKSGAIFQDNGCESSGDKKGDMHSNVNAVCSSDSSSGNSVGESDSSEDTTRNGSDDEEGRSTGEKNTKLISSKEMTMDMILRSSKRFKKAKLLASQDDEENIESQAIEFVPESQAS